jgi:hypothetical protein
MDPNYLVSAMKNPNPVTGWWLGRQDENSTTASTQPSRTDMSRPKRRIRPHNKSRRGCLNCKTRRVKVRLVAEVAPHFVQQTNPTAVSGESSCLRELPGKGLGLCIPAWATERRSVPWRSSAGCLKPTCISAAPKTSCRVYHC